MVHFVLFIHRESGLEAKRFRKGIESALLKTHHEICQSIPELQWRLRRPRPYGELDVFILIADTDDRLRRLVALTDYLEGKSLILVLPKNERDSRSKGFQLWPRYLTSMDNGFEDLCAVLNKFVEKNAPNSEAITKNIVISMDNVS